MTYFILKSLLDDKVRRGKGSPSRSPALITHLHLVFDCKAYDERKGHVTSSKPAKWKIRTQLRPGQNPRAVANYELRGCQHSRARKYTESINKHETARNSILAISTESLFMRQDLGRVRIW